MVLPGDIDPKQHSGRRWARAFLFCHTSQSTQLYACKLHDIISDIIKVLSLKNINLVVRIMMKKKTRKIESYIFKLHAI